MTDLFLTWWEKHWDKPVTATGLPIEVQAILNPQQRRRQWLAQRLIELTGTRAAGFVLTRATSGRWNAATYALLQTEQNP